MTNESRLPFISDLALDSYQKKVLQDILSGPRGNLDGPFLAWIHSPELADHAQRLGAFCRYSTSLPTRLSELAILATAAWWRSQAEWQIHEPIARAHGLGDEVIESVREGNNPTFTKQDEAMVYRFTQLLYSARRIDQTTYEEAESLFGIAGVVELVGLLGYYALVAMTLNVFNIRHQENHHSLPFNES